MLVAVQLRNSVESLLQRFAVSCEANHGEDEVRIILRGGCAADLEDFGLVARVDVVAAGGAGVARENGEVGAGDGECGAAVVGVSMIVLENYEVGSV
jgi:hypothetical protein